MGGLARRHLRLAVAAVLLISAARAQPAETEHELKFSYVRGDERGPEHWGDLSAPWAACGAGKMQSPIDLHHERVSLVRGLGYLTHSYRPAQASIHNRGHDIMVTFEGHDAGGLVINGTAYYLKQLHWHSPTEHTVDGRRYDMELHLVHESAPPASKTAVIGILYEVGAGEDPFLRRLEPSIRLVADTNNTEPIGVVDPRGAQGRASVYYRYMGSLTTPPCTEGVVWTVVKKVRTVSRYQLELLREAVHDNMENNARPLQEVNDRDISIFRTKSHRH